MKKNFIIFAIIILLNLSANAQLKFIDSANAEKVNKSDSESKRETKKPNNYIELNKLGVQKGLIENDYKAALALFQRALELNPECFTCRYNVARSYLSLENFDKAKSIFGALVKEDKNFADGYAGLGEVLFNQGRFEESIPMYQEALKINPTDALVMNNYANSLDRLGKYKKALELFNKAIKLDSSQAVIYANRGMTQYKMKRYKSALKSLKKANELDNADANIHNSLGVVLAELGREKQALKHYAEALRLDPEQHAVIYNLGIFYFAKGKNDEAQKQLKILEKKDFELAKSLRKVLWSKYVLDAKSVKKKN